jgi:sulfur dioxygenase
MLFRQLFDSESSTYTYLLADSRTREAVLIDPVREQHERDWAILDELGLKLVHTLETHVHADHVTGSGLMRERAKSTSVMSVHAGAGCADRLVTTGETIDFGECSLEARLTPGHTSGCVSFVDHAGGRVFSGDALLIRGCGRTDFQQGDARTLYASVHEQLFALPDETSLFPGHDYKGRTSSTIGEEKEHNPRLGKRKSVDEFIEVMANLQLAPPTKIDIAVPANLGCGVARPEVDAHRA